MSGKFNKKVKYQKKNFNIYNRIKPNSLKNSTNLKFKSDLKFKDYAKFKKSRVTKYDSSLFEDIFNF